MPYQIVNFQIDTWVLNVKGKLPDNGLADYLNRLQEGARDIESDLATEWTFRGMTLYIKPHGAGRQWRWLLYCGDHYLHLDLGKGKMNGICCKVRMSSQLLHEMGPGEALTAVYGFLASLLGEGFALQVSEVHVCADVAGWDLALDDTHAFVTRGRSKRARLEDETADEDDSPSVPEVTITGRRVTQFDFSKTAPHSCCIYDKTKEVQVHQKQWFHEIWKQHGWDGESRVTRIEFRYERECLREMGIEEPYEMLDQIPSMWAYSTQKWLRHTLPNGDMNQSRWPASPVWILIQQPPEMGDAVPAVREKKVELDAERAKAGFVGYATSWAVREVFRYQQGAATETGDPLGLPLHVVEDDGAGFLAWAFDPVKLYLDARKEATFVEIMQEKAKRLGLLLIA
jgi:hypothetical protein